jgi:hypothetical protein
VAAVRQQQHWQQRQRERQQGQRERQQPLLPCPLRCWLSLQALLAHACSAGRHRWLDASLSTCKQLPVDEPPRRNPASLHKKNPASLSSKIVSTARARGRGRRLRPRSIHVS